MILIVEGSNRVGKSTLIESLKKQAKNYGKEIILFNERIAKDKEVVQTKEKMYEYAEKVIEELDRINSEDKLIIFDRFHISELVYGAYYRGYINYGMHVIDTKLYHMNANLIWIVSYYDHIKDEENKKKYRELQTLFNRAYEMSFIKKRVHIIDKIERIDEIAEGVLRWIS